MAFSDDDFQFLRESRANKNHAIWVVAFILLALAAVSLSTRGSGTQPVRQTTSTTTRSTQGTRTNTQQISSVPQAVQRERIVSIQKQEKLVVIVKEAQTSHSAPPPVVITKNTAQPQRPQPAPAVTPAQERKVPTRAELDAELVRRAEQNARDKAEIDRLEAEKKSEKSERMRLAEVRERKERLERLRQQRESRRRIWFYRIPKKDPTQTQPH